MGITTLARSMLNDVPKPKVPMPKIKIYRSWLEYDMLEPEVRTGLPDVVEEWRTWQRNREAEIERFKVDDDRSPAFLDAEKGVRKQLKKVGGKYGKGR